MAKQTQTPVVEKKPAPPEESIEEVRIERIGNEKWRVVVARYVKVPGSERVLEPSVSLPVARAEAIKWRAHRGGIGWELP